MFSQMVMRASMHTLHIPDASPTRYSLGNGELSQFCHKAQCATSRACGGSGANTSRSFRRAMRSSCHCRGGCAFSTDLAAAKRVPAEAPDDLPSGAFFLLPSSLPCRVKHPYLRSISAAPFFDKLIILSSILYTYCTKRGSRFTCLVLSKGSSMATRSEIFPGLVCMM